MQIHFMNYFLVIDFSFSFNLDRLIYVKGTNETSIEDQSINSIYPDLISLYVYVYNLYSFILHTNRSINSIYIHPELISLSTSIYIIYSSILHAFLQIFSSRVSIEGLNPLTRSTHYLCGFICLPFGLYCHHFYWLFLCHY